ncbi:TIGR02680 family protein [Bacillus swezeyi]|uniref:TIGR02680 family protein n=1 Tax=Bacillus swezeyi TaxID=1925020 RepID=UPI0039C5B7AB
MKEKWKLNRAGIFNFWYYDDEVFEFEDGKLLLRGSNGSGKSVTMQSFLPVLLDGNKTPARLDPFSSNSRKMADYLLGEKEISKRDERTGYLFIEYKKENTNQYMTTGMGMQAKRNQPLKSWGFVITDNRRIGYDLELFKWVNEGREKKKFPRSQTELEAAVGHGGEVVSSNKEYMALVNKYIFGFETLEAYDDLIKLLIQLRSPKLSKDFKPTVIYEILEQALPPLTDEDLRYLSDSIEQMDQTKQQMEQLEREVKALKKLNDLYNQYNERILLDQVNGWKQAKIRRQKEEQELLDLKDQLKNLDEELLHLMEKQADLERRKNTLKEAEKRLMNHEVFRLQDELQAKQKTETELEKDEKRRNDRLERLLKKERESEQKMRDLDERQDAEKQKITEMIEEIAYEGEESAFSQHRQNAEDFARHIEEPFHFELWKKEIQEHTNRLEKALDALHLQEQLKMRIEEKNVELGEAERIRDQIQEDERKWRDFLEEERQNLIHAIHLWTDKHDKYEIPSAVLQEITRLIDDVFDRVEYEEVKERIHPYINKYEEILKMKKLQLDAEQQRLESEVAKLKEESDVIKSQTDPVPPRHEATIEARKLLKESEVQFAPLYELVEFQTHVTEDVQKRIESALFETGLLDALVTEEEIQLKHDRILLAEPKLFSRTFADYLKADESQTKLPKERIQDILQSIAMDGEAQIHFAEDGTYQFANFRGHALPLDEVRYIGRKARKRYREQLIAELEQKMETCNEQRLQFIKESQETLAALEASKSAWKTFPSSADMKESYNEMCNAQNFIRVRNEEIQRISQHISTLDNKLQDIKKRIYLLTERINLKQNEESYRNALAHSRRYEKDLDQIHREHESHIRLIQDYEREFEIQREIQEEIDEIRGDLNIIEGKRKTIKAGITQIREQLQLQGAEDIRREIRAISDELPMVEKAKDEAGQRIAAQKENRKNIEIKKDNKQKSAAFWTKIESAWDETLSKEWKRTVNDEQFDDDHIEEFLLKKNGIKDRTALEGQVTNLFYVLQTDLIEHKMNRHIEKPEPAAWMDEVDQEEWKLVIEQWKLKSARQIIEFDQRGIKISPKTLYENVSHEWAIQDNRLDEMDKKLYEEILLNSVGYKLRGRIRRAEQWTEKMKKIMENSDSSSGLKFSIKWRPKTADTERELDTKDLVYLLKQDANLLNDQDLERITNHFRSKIQAAKAFLEEKGDGQTLLQVLKMVLDYRKWFSFVLYFKRPNEPKRELTNYNFFKFSGGEKAMAMYIPLFTACYSRYQEAAPHAPFIISLDEAFAGVDENNINEMFEIVEELGFNYIMNSQVLWGDYETVSSLSVCELIRPKNANYVTVIHYKWDGKTLNTQIPEGAGVT